jgi:hypothetical protein
MEKHGLLIIGMVFLIGMFICGRIALADEPAATTYISVSEATGSVCPAWTGIDGSCAIRIEKIVIGSKHIYVNLNNYWKERITFIKNNIQITDPHNIIITTDNGILVDLSIPIAPGTYIISKTQVESEANFTLYNPLGGNEKDRAYLNGEAVAPDK